MSELCVITGEASGDLHAAQAVRALRKLDPTLGVFGVGGSHLQEEGVELLYHVRDLAIVGLFNVIRHVPMYRRVMNSIEAEIERRRPGAVLLVDFPDFNLRLAKRLQRLDVPILYYISPQIWAWRKQRVRQIAATVDHMMVIFPFEEELFTTAGVPVTYVGHPLVEQLEAYVSDEVRPVPEGTVRVALLPGSRSMEVDALLPSMLQAVEQLRSDRQIEVFLIQASTISRERLEQVAGGRLDGVEIVDRNRAAALARADVALASSGTATLEAAILGVPMVVMYRLTALTYALARRLVDLDYFSLVNIVAGEEVVPELLQNEVRPDRIAEEVGKLLEPARYTRMVEGLRSVREKLGRHAAGATVAGVVIEKMKESSQR
jgi:lipid-A-disaccharide synthase